MNVHPSKKIVKFSNDKIVYNEIKSAIDDFFYYNDRENWQPNIDLIKKNININENIAVEKDDLFSDDILKGENQKILSLETFDGKENSEKLEGENGFTGGNLEKNDENRESAGISESLSRGNFFNDEKKDYLFDIIYWSNNDIKKNKTYFEDISDIKEFAKKKVYSTGGTDVTEFHKYLNERYKEPIEVINITDGYFFYDKNLNSNIQKYHFVLTEELDKRFKDFYSGNTFDVVSIKQEKN